MSMYKYIHVYNVHMATYILNNGKHISWKHLENFYESDHGQGTGLAMVPKLKYEHVHLTSFSKMRVDLAAQVNIACILWKCVPLYLYGCMCIVYLLFSDTLHTCNQVLSESVSHALKMSGNQEVQGTAEFVGMFDKFFDILNVTNFTNAKSKRKAFQRFKEKTLLF